MTTSITPVDEWPASFFGHANGDAVDGPNSVAELQAFANALEYLKRRAYGASKGILIVPIVPSYNSNFVFTSVVGSPLIWNQAGTASTDMVIVPIPAPMPYTVPLRITSIICTYKPNSGHAGVLPASQPTLRLIKQPELGGNSTVEASVQDSAGSAAAYEAGRTLSMTVNITLTASPLFLQFIGESGANSVAGLDLASMTVFVEP